MWHMRRTLLLLALSAALSVTLAFAQAHPSLAPCAGTKAAGPLNVASKPADAPSTWKPLIGEYQGAATRLNVLENCGKLYLLLNDAYHSLQPVSATEYHVSPSVNGNNTIRFVSDRNHVTQLQSDGNAFQHIFGEDTGKSFRIAPLRPPEDLRKEALAAQPPHELGKRAPDLIELTNLDPSIKLDIRYATSNNFMGTPFYTEARAFLQRPAAQALVRANRKLKAYGYGLLIHDAYRPWYVTKMFWDATPDDKKDFVADPAKGSNHNRGGAVDLSLYELSTGKPVRMPGGYDEMSDRSYPGYPGGTSLERWQRDLLRAAMESEGFRVYKVEWWHFDFRDYNSYPVLNIPFERISPSSKTESN